MAGLAAQVRHNELVPETCTDGLEVHRRRSIAAQDLWRASQKSTRETTAIRSHKISTLRWPPKKSVNAACTVPPGRHCLHARRKLRGNQRWQICVLSCRDLINLVLDGCLAP